MNAHAKYIFIDGTFMPTQPSHNQMITQERHVQKQNRRSPWQNLYARRICTHRFMVRFQSVQGVALKKRLQSSNESGTFVNSSNGTHFSPKSLSDRLSRRNDGLIPAWTSQVMVYVNMQCLAGKIASCLSSFYLTNGAPRRTLSFFNPCTTSFNKLSTASPSAAFMR